MSINPGARTRPVPSISRAAVSVRRASTADIRPSRTATSTNPGAPPVPSMTVAPRINKSSMRYLRARRAAVRRRATAGGAVLLLAGPPGRTPARASERGPRRHPRRWRRLSSGRPRGRTRGPGSTSCSLVDGSSKRPAGPAAQVRQQARRHRLADRQGGTRPHRPTLPHRGDDQRRGPRPPPTRTSAAITPDRRGACRRGAGDRAQTVA